MPKPTRKPAITALKPVVVTEDRAEKVQGGYNPKELSIDKVVRIR